MPSHRPVSTTEIGIADRRVPFLATVSPDRRSRILETSAAVSEALDAWARGYPMIRRVRVAPLALSVTAAAPFCSTAELTATARVSLWVFTLDDLIDEGGVPADTLQRRVDGFRSVTLGRSVERRDELGAALADARRDIASYPLFTALQDQWEAALLGTIDGMLREEEWRRRWQSGEHWRPTYSDYVRNGRYSIGGPPHVWSALIAVGDPSTPAHGQFLREMEREASTGIRLANDLRSYEKEIREGKLNSVILLVEALRRTGLAEKAALELAEARIQQEIERGLSRLTALENEHRTTSGHPESAIRDIGRFVCEFYARHDYHTFSDPPSQLLTDRIRSTLVVAR